MPALWQDDLHEAPDASGASPVTGQRPAARLCLWPHRSLTPEGFAIFIGITAALIFVPAIPLLGTPVLWGLLPFLAGAVWMIWTALRRNLRDRTVSEELTLWPDHVHLVHREPDGTAQEWDANPFWVTVHLHRTGGPVENYVTLKGGGREVEIGAFLAPEERVALHHELEAALARLRTAAHPT